VAAPDSDRAFVGAVAELYADLMVPMLFVPYADDLARRLHDIGSGSILEIAAGTGVVTRALAQGLPDAVSITATDLNQAMLDGAVRAGTARPVRWHRADVMTLPFESESFDVVVCQFGVMFFDPKAAAFAEVHRVLRPGGLFVFNVWGDLDSNEFAGVVNRAVNASPTDEPSRFFERTPHGYHDRETIAGDLRDGGFEASPSIEQVDEHSRAATALDAARGFCLGTPLRGELDARGPGRLVEGTAVAADALEQRFGKADLVGRLSALVVTVRK
jgi:SAM-dependent methyltransferase